MARQKTIAAVEEEEEAKTKEAKAKEARILIGIVRSAA